MLTHRLPRIAAALLTVLFLVAPPLLARKLGPFNVTLRYAPQEGTGATVPSLMLGIADHPVQLSVTDARTIPDPAVIGDSSDDEDRVWPVRSTGSVVDWAREVLAKNAGEWGVRAAAEAPLRLEAELLRFFVVESNKPVGSMYAADVRVGARLLDARGAVLWQGAASGDATRYGKSRKAGNVSEVLSDATKEAYARLLGEPALQRAWLGKPSPAVAEGGAQQATGLTPPELLVELVRLDRERFSSEMLVAFVNQAELVGTLSADDMVQWQDAGMPSEVIRAALERAEHQ